MEAINDDLQCNKLYSAAISINKVLNILRIPCGEVDESAIRIFPAIKNELISQKIQLSQRLKEKWHTIVKIEMKENTKDKKKIHSLFINATADKQRSEFVDVVEALQATDTLEDILEPFVKSLKNDFLDPLIKGLCLVEASGATLKLTGTFNPEKPGLTPLDRMDRLMMFFAFVLKHLSVQLPVATSLQQNIGEKLSSWFCNAMIK